MGATLTYLGHSSFLIRSGGGKTIYIDPWLEGNPRCPENLQAPQKRTSSASPTATGITSLLLFRSIKKGRVRWRAPTNL